MGKIVLLMGESSTGKDTLKSAILKRTEFSEYGFKNIVLHTTRPIRTGEKDGEDYHYVTDEKMNQLDSEGKIIEKRSYDTVHGIWNYFTCSDAINLYNNYLTVNTLEAYDQFLKYFGDEYLVPILIKIDSGLRLQRALDRERSQANPKYAEMCRRFLADSEDFSLENIKKRNITDFCDNNGDINEALENVGKILTKKL